MMSRRWVLLAAAGLLAACQTDGVPPESGGDPDPQAQAECEAEGGTYERGGLLQDYICFTATPDAGKACTTGADCNGLCLAESMTCSTVRPLFGCHDMITNDGIRTVICID